MTTRITFGGVHIAHLDFIKKLCYHREAKISFGEQESYNRKGVYLNVTRNI